MKLTLIAPDNVYEHEVDPSMEVRDIQALIEAETSIPSSSQTLSTDSGVPLIDPLKSLEAYGVQGESGTLFLTFKEIQPVASTSYGAPAEYGNDDDEDADTERMRLQALGDPQLMSQLRQYNPEFAAAIESGKRFRDLMRSQRQSAAEATAEKNRQIELLNADPYDIEAQKKIEEAIRMEAVIENMQHAMEYSPEAFGRVTMLYINVEVNGHPVKAFVDSGAQTTIISSECAEACGIMRLLDKRFAGVALGVGTANILGRIHSAQIKLGNLFLPVAFSVLEGRPVDLLFGLDMLKRHQACIDLSTNTLRIGTTEIPFLSEHELPPAARRMNEQAIAGEMGEASSQGKLAGVASPKISASSSSGQATLQRQQQNTTSGSRSGSGGGPLSNAESLSSGDSHFSPAAIETLINLGASRDQAIQLLQACDGNVDVAASMLFG